jgi:lysophospholipase L1-like esterase
MDGWARKQVHTLGIVSLLLGVWIAFPPLSLASKKTPILRKPVSVAAMGDSLTDPKSHGGLYLKEIEKVCPKSSFANFGKGGNMVNQMRRRFDHDLYGTPDNETSKTAKTNYTHVIVFGGVNDICSDESATRTNPKIQRDLSLMYQSARRHGAKVVAINVAPWGGFKKYYNRRRANSTLVINRWIQAQVDHHEVDYVINAHALLSCGSSGKLCKKYMHPFKDGIHFGKEGHRVLGQALIRKVFSACQ